VDRCLFCGAFAVKIHVHGHFQCASCGQNVDPCCSGEVCDPEERIFGRGEVVDNDGTVLEIPE